MIGIYAMIETSGKQYRVSQGDVIRVEKLNAAEGETIKLDRMLTVSDSDKLLGWTAGAGKCEGYRNGTKARQGQKYPIGEFKAAAFVPSFTGSTRISPCTTTLLAPIFLASFARSGITESG